MYLKTTATLYTYLVVIHLPTPLLIRVLCTFRLLKHLSLLVVVSF